MSKQGLASVGIALKIDSKELNYVQEIGDIGGTPSDLDATCLKDQMKKHVPGVQDTSAFEVTYLRQQRHRFRFPHRQGGAECGHH